MLSAKIVFWLQLEVGDIVVLRLLRDVAATAAAADASSSVMTPSRSVFLFFYIYDYVFILMSNAM